MKAALNTVPNSGNCDSLSSPVLEGVNALKETRTLRQTHTFPPQPQKLFNEKGTQTFWNHKALGTYRARNFCWQHLHFKSEDTLLSFSAKEPGPSYKNPPRIQ